MFLTNSSTGDVDWEGVRLGDFGSAVEVALAGKTTLSGLQTRWVEGEGEGGREGGTCFLRACERVRLCT